MIAIMKKSIISEFRFSSCRENLPPAVKVVTDAIINTRLPVSLSDDELKLVLDEAITNAMEHGNGWSIDKWVEVSLGRCKEGLKVEVKDQGFGFKPDESSSSPGLSWRGRGIRIMQHFCNCTWNERGDAVSMTIPLSRLYSGDHNFFITPVGEGEE